MFQLLASRDGGQSWAPRQANLVFEEPLACAIAPYGLAEHAPLLVGLADGGVRRI